MNNKIGEPIRSCGTCEFSHGQLAKGPKGEIVIGQEQLICMRRPPQIVMMVQKTALGDQSAMLTQFPPVTREMYCFDYWPEGEPIPGPDLLDLINGEIVRDN